MPPAKVGTTTTSPTAKRGTTEKANRRTGVGTRLAECARPRAMPLGFGPCFFALKRHRRAGLCRILSAIFPQQGRSHVIKQLLDTSAILQSALEHGDHGPRHVQATPPSLLGEGQQVVRMLVPAGAGRAVGSDTGFTHLSQRTFEGGPQGQELVQEALLNR